MTLVAFVNNLGAILDLNNKAVANSARILGRYEVDAIVECQTEQARNPREAAADEVEVESVEAELARYLRHRFHKRSEHRPGRSLGQVLALALELGDKPVDVFRAHRFWDCKQTAGNPQRSEHAQPVSVGGDHVGRPALWYASAIRFKVDRSSRVNPAVDGRQCRAQTVLK